MDISERDSAGVFSFVYKNNRLWDGTGVLRFCISRTEEGIEVGKTQTEFVALGVR